MKRFPTVTVALVLANLLAYLVELAVGGQAFCQAHGFVPARFMRNGDLGPAFSSMFLHDPATLVHLGGNMACLAVFGTLVERALGSVRFTILYFVAGLGGALVHAAVCPHATDALVGASGAIFGVLAVAGAMNRRLLGFVVAFLGLNIWYALAGTGGTISFGDHIGGFAMGVVFALAARVAGSDLCEAA